MVIGSIEVFSAESNYPYLNISPIGLIIRLEKEKYWFFFSSLHILYIIGKHDRKLGILL